MPETLASPVQPRTILVVEDNQGQLDTIVYTLSDHGIDSEGGTPVLTASSGREALEIVRERADDLAVVLTDLKMPGRVDGIALLAEAVTLAPRARRILVTAYAGELTLRDAINSGRINHFLEKGYQRKELVDVVKRALDEHRELMTLIRENAELRARADETRVLETLVGEAEAVVALKEEIARVSRVDTHVLVLGETGTGKELVARSVHDLSPRAAGPFVAINCAAVPESLLEGEFFGTRKGAYSGAVDRKGLIETASGGTLFLDEVGKAPVAIQSKLLRFLDTGRILPVGAREEIESDVRIVAAANEDLEEAIEQGSFLKDLYYRLRGSRLRNPPLRERLEDLGVLARHFLDGFNRTYGRVVLGFDEGALEAMRGYGWPGNVRELEEAIRDAVVRRVEDGAFIGAADLGLGDAPAETGVPAAAPAEGGLAASVAAELGVGSDLAAIRAAVERAALEVALEEASGVIEAVARRLGVSRPWVYDRIQKYGIERPG